MESRVKNNNLYLMRSNQMQSKGATCAYNKRDSVTTQKRDKMLRQLLLVQNCKGFVVQKKKMKMRKRKRERKNIVRWITYVSQI